MCAFFHSLFNLSIFISHSRVDGSGVKWPCRVYIFLFFKYRGVISWIIFVLFDVSKKMMDMLVEKCDPARVRVDSLWKKFINNPRYLWIAVVVLNKEMKSWSKVLEVTYVGYFCTNSACEVIKLFRWYFFLQVLEVTCIPVQIAPVKLIIFSVNIFVLSVKS